jgi:hypothetical protein
MSSCPKFSPEKTKNPLRVNFSENYTADEDFCSDVIPTKRSDTNAIRRSMDRSKERHYVRDEITTLTERMNLT